MQSTLFEEKVFPMKDRLFRFALVWLKNREEAEDAVQEILARMWLKRDQIHDIQNVEAYTIRMIRNECMNRLSSKQRKWTSLERVEHLASDQHPDRDYLQQELVRVLMNFIAALPEQQQLVIMLRDVEGLEISEIEKITEMTANNVRVTLSIARKKIQEAYQGYESHERK